MTDAAMLDECYRIVDEPPSAVGSTCVYAELFDTAASLPEGKAVARDFDTTRAASIWCGNLKERLKLWGRRNERWACLTAYRRGATVYVARRER